MSDAPRQPPPKKDVALALLEESSMFIHLDPRRPNVAVPKWFTGQPQLVLQVGLNMAIPIPDLKVDDFGITCTLSFNRAPFWCKIPWASIYALVGEDGRGGVWADDVPPEIQLQKQATPQKQPAAKRQRPRLASVGGGGNAAERRDEPEFPPEPEKEPSPIARIGPRAVPPLAEAGSPAPAEEADEPGASSPSAPPPADRKKSKREIPPYLRVIK